MICVFQLCHLLLLKPCSCIGFHHLHLLLHIKQTAFPNMTGLTQSAEGLNRTKVWSYTKKEKILYWMTACELGHWLFPAFGLKIKYKFFLVLKSAGLQEGTTPLCLLVPGLQSWTITKPSAFLGLRLTDSTCRSWDLSASVITSASISCYKCLFR